MKPQISIITPVKARVEEERDWLREAIQSVQQQDYQRWEMVIVDDASNVSLAEVQAETDDDRIRWFHTKGVGAASARNQAAAQAEAPMLLPLDGDDKLAPNALTRFWQAWGSGGEQQGIVYSDVLRFGQDWQKLFAAPEYDFQTLLTSTFMSIGCLHRKGAWNRVQGWRRDMEEGLEDWEYWVHMGEVGECGYHIPEPLYWYRENPRGRLLWLKEDNTRFQRAYQKMRSLHLETYNGRWPVGCCGGKKAKPKGQRAAQSPAQAGLVEMRYSGGRRGSFVLRGRESGEMYHVPGAGGTLQVKAEDVDYLRAFHRGRDCQEVTGASVPVRQQPRPLQRPQPVQQSAPGPLAQLAQPMQPETPKWPDRMPEPVQADPQPDVNELSVTAIKALELTPLDAVELLRAEQAGKARITAIRHLQAVAGGEA
jgi:hypothetical protein